MTTPFSKLRDLESATDPAQPDWMRCPHGACQVKEACDSPDVCAVAESAAQPVEATPEFDHGAYMTDRRITKFQRRKRDADIERQLSLAQTENAGHIRIEDELKADLERERMRVVGCSVAALGNWKEGDTLHADYDCVAIRDVAKLRAKFDEAQARCDSDMVPVPREPTEEIVKAMEGADKAADYTGLGLSETQRYCGIYRAIVEAAQNPGMNR